MEALMTIAEFRQELKNKRDYFYQFPWPATTYGHWSAGRYFTTFNDYHLMLTATVKSSTQDRSTKYREQHITEIQAVSLLLYAAATMHARMT